MKKLVLFALTALMLMGCKKEDEYANALTITNLSGFTWYKTLVGVYDDQGKATTYEPSEETVEVGMTITAARKVHGTTITVLKSAEYFDILCRDSDGNTKMTAKLSFSGKNTVVKADDFKW